MAMSLTEGKFSACNLIVSGGIRKSSESGTHKGDSAVTGSGDTLPCMILVQPAIRRGSTLKRFARPHGRRVNLTQSSRL